MIANNSDEKFLNLYYFQLKYGIFLKEMTFQKAIYDGIIKKNGPTF